MEFQQWFPDHEACAEYLFESRWPEGFRCPRCGHGHSWPVSKRRVLLECAACHLQTSLTAGTVLHKTRPPLHLWFWAVYLMSTPTPGTSALQLQRQLGLGRYETAWMLHKLRRAMINPEREPLTGEVEVDEGFVGGVEAGLRGGRARGTKPLLSWVLKPAALAADGSAWPSSTTRRTPMAAFQTLLGLQSQQPPTTYRQIVARPEPVPAHLI